MELLYKVVETSTVTDDTLEEIINEWVSKGWNFEGIQFAVRDASKRPGMAFVLFTREDSLNPKGESSEDKPEGSSG
jgi:hypothetical protein